jgi:tRNA G18 (ribose-2'-O)-methylase SpoU
MIKQTKALLPSSLLILNDIRSVINVGALFRTADAIGISKIILSGVTPAPVDRFGRKRSDFIKASLGSEDSVAWEEVKNIISTLKALKKEGFTIVAIEQTKNSLDYKDFKTKLGQKIAIIPGNEVSGVPKKILDRADVILELPMRGKKESLNVTVATGIVLYRLLDQ